MDVLAVKKAAEARREGLKKKVNPNSERNFTDDRFWTLDYNKETNIGKAIIRPIGPAPRESDEFVAEYTHFLKRNGKYLSLNCPSTTGQKDCPICKYYWSKDKAEREPQYSRNTKYIMNILVVKDFIHPENDGKVFLYRCPTSIMNKIKEALNDTDEMGMEKPSINVFDMWEGANINIITKDKAGWLSYDSSNVANPSPIFEDVDNPVPYQELYERLYPLNEFKAAPTVAEVTEKFNEFMGNMDTSINNIENHIKSEQKSVLIDDEIPEVFEKKSKSIFEDEEDDIPELKENITESEIEDDDFFSDL